MISTSRCNCDWSGGSRDDSVGLSWLKRDRSTIGSQTGTCHLIHVEHFCRSEPLICRQRRIDDVSARLIWSNGCDCNAGSARGLRSWTCDRGCCHNLTPYPAYPGGAKLPGTEPGKAFGLPPIPTPPPFD